jgi:hypothetical protein
MFGQVPGEMLAMTCDHEVDNARPVFPGGGKPFIRTRRDQDLIINLEAMGLVTLSLFNWPV